MSHRLKILLLLALGMCGGGSAFAQYYQPSSMIGVDPNGLNRIIAVDATGSLAVTGAGNSPPFTGYAAPYAAYGSFNGSPVQLRVDSTGALVLSGSSGGITLTTNGSSGPSTLLSGVLNVPNYSSNGTVNSGTAGQFAFYNATGAAVSGNSDLDDGATTAGFITSAKPFNLNYPITNNDTSSSSVYPGALNINFTATTSAQTVSVSSVALVSGQTYAFTTAPNTLIAGRVIYFPVSETNFNNFTGGATALNGQTVTVLSSGLSSTTFQAVITGTVSSSSTGIGYTPFQAVLPAMRIVATGPGYTSLCPAEYYQGTLYGASFCIEAAPLGVGGPDASAIFGASYTIDPYVGSNASQFFAYCLNSYTRCWGTNPSAQIINVHTAASGTIGQNTITLSSLPGYGTIYPTMGIWNSTGITDGTQVQSISGLTLTLTAPNIGAVSGQVNFAPMHANINASEFDMHAEAPASFGNAYLGALIGLSIASNLPTGGTWNATGIRLPAIFCKTADNTPCYYKQGISFDAGDFFPSTGTVINIGATGTATCVSSPTTDPCENTSVVTNYGSTNLESDDFSIWDYTLNGGLGAASNGSFRRQVQVPVATYNSLPTSFTENESLSTVDTGATPIKRYVANGAGGAWEIILNGGSGNSAMLTVTDATGQLGLNGLNALVSAAGVVTGTGFATGSAGTNGAVVFGSAGGGTVTLQPATGIATTNTLLFPNSALASDTIVTEGVSNTFSATQNFVGITLAAANSLTWLTRSKLESQSDGEVLFCNNACTGFTKLQLGGTTNAFPELLLNGAGLDVRLADNSGDATLLAGAITASGSLNSNVHNIGASGTLGTAVFGNNASGTITLQAVAGTLGTGTMIIPIPAGGSDTLVTEGISNTFSVSQTMNAGLVMGTNQTITWLTRGKISSPADGNFEFQANAGGQPNRFQFGGTTSSFAGLCFSGTTITVCGADGSNVGALVSPSVSSAAFLPTAVESIVGCSTSGSVNFSQPLQGSSDKKVIMHFSACLGTASYTFPVAFTNVPSVFASNNVAATIVTAGGSISQTAITVNGTTTTGALILEDF